MTTQSPPTTKVRCKVCQRTALLYSEMGIHIRCHRCKSEEILTWEKVLQLYEEIQMGKRL